MLRMKLPFQMKIFPANLLYHDEKWLKLIFCYKNNSGYIKNNLLCCISNENKSLSFLHDNGPLQIEAFSSTGPFQFS